MYKRQSPKKTIISRKHHPNEFFLDTRDGWHKRNDSSTISTILTENSDPPSRRLIFSKNHPLRNKFHHTTCTSCYCNEEPIRPTLLTSPEGSDCDCKRGGTTRCFKPPPEPPLIYTNQREDYEEITRNDYFLNLKEYLNYLEGELENKNKSKIDKGCQINTTSSLNDLNNFRKQNFFDCHGIEKSSVKVDPHHVCTYKFNLDDDFKVRGLNTDPYGISRCNICQKPSFKVSDATDGSPTSSFETFRSNYFRIPVEKVVNSTKTVFRNEKNFKNKKSSKFIMDFGDNKVEMEVPNHMMEDQSLKRLRRNRKFPVDSMALRHQKGVL